MKLQVTTPSPTEIRMTRTFDAPKALVIEAMTTPALVMRWLGNSRSPITSAEIDLRPGGRYRYVFRLPDGKEFALSGVHEKITPDRIVFTQVMEGMPGESKNTTTFVEQNGVTTMTVTLRFPDQQTRDMVLATGMTDGAGESYDNLASVLSGAAAQ
ncbi:MAG TPA: SRPBCC family protein [Kofleriaceae bacterium]|jgi:uncharacterized protein YndB with AHSA1/START domain